MSETPADGSLEEKIQANVLRAGELFVLSLWIQGQMADLNIFGVHPELVAPFQSVPETIPPEFAALRFAAWQGDFSPIKLAFVDQFQPLLTPQDLEDLEFLNTLRNAIGHSHVSMGQDYFLYRPRTKKDQAIADALKLPPRAGASDPMMVKLAFYNDAYYLECFNRIKRLDEECLSRVAASLGLTHSRIR